MSKAERQKLEDKASLVLNELKVLRIAFRNLGLTLSADNISEAIGKTEQAVATSRKGKGNDAP